MFDSFTDILVGALIFLLVFNWNTIEEPMHPDAQMQTWRKFYRVHGVDRVKAEEMREELKRRGVPDPPQFTMGGKKPEDVMAELQTMMQNVPYEKTQMDKAFTDKTPCYSSSMTPWPRHPEMDDVTNN